MTINLRPEHEQLIAQAIRSGAYQTVDQVVERALEILRAEEESLLDDKVAVGEKIERAFAQFERGEFFTAAESHADMQQRKTAWLAERNR